MAAVTLSVLTRADKDYQEAVSQAAAGSASAGTVTVVFDDTQTLEELFLSIEKAKMYLAQTYGKR